MKRVENIRNIRRRVQPYSLAFIVGMVLAAVFGVLQHGLVHTAGGHGVKAHVETNHTSAASVTQSQVAGASTVQELAPVVTSIPTTKPVVFLTIDDGIHTDPVQLQLLKDNNVKASLFLVDRFTHNTVPFFRDFIPAGSRIENHGATHYLLPDQPYEEQKKDICTQANLEERQYGQRPTLFRPSGGLYNDITRKATAACDMKALVLWTAEAKNGVMEYANGGGLKPGDIVLMHFTPNFTSDFQAFLEAQRAAGLHTELLENYISAYE